MSSWLSSAVTRAEAVSDWLAPQRQASLALLRDAKWPTRKTEAWKYLPINVWDNTELQADAAESTDATSGVIEGLNSLDLVFVNGQLQSVPGDDLPAGLTVVSLADASGDARAWAAETFTAVKPARHLFGLVNDVLATQGVLIDVAAAAVIEQPIRIVNVLTKGYEAHTRVLVRLGEHAKATVIEHYVGDQRSKNTGFAEYKVGDSAYLEHYRFALQSGESLSIGGSHFELSARAELSSHLVGFGSTLQRVDVDVTHAGEHAFAKLNAIYLLDGKELFDLHSTIEHAVPNGTTEENVRGIVADNSRAVFNGRIHIHRGAQKTLAELNNRNLLMSDRAEINTKPELEIYADDVRCAHGATIAEIDKKALYYMQSRGVSRSQAQIMLNFGFINELVDQMPNQVLADWLRPQLRDRFAGMEVK
ncbi:Fe-S cluster assembly protein SufD [Aestuariicella hydrocarbonica]|uniref:Fe-S cluster assembly protein SufD n=1 Tax=Pseudomaricurvus hydrocarbonicus TaxID=1470433 RepID=A0A9E5MQE4_9GAMM|nr:Fe-S cluster assembly protein SufD [Aestuariicella hydrocarbonica]NHO68444.1 Fe-S cluster assembly protein SufD [Aestuariicella hydrocarbonica]